MGERLTQSDVKKIQEEIDYRKLVVRKEAIEAVKEPSGIRIKTRAGSVIWREC